jgi:hypothetical protein
MLYGGANIFFTKILPLTTSAHPTTHHVFIFEIYI